MIKCVVEMFGLPRQVTEVRGVEVGLEDGASLRDVVAALRHEIPALEGPVIRAGENRLLEHYTFNVNGSFYFADSDVQLKDGDFVLLLTLPTGG